MIHMISFSDLRFRRRTFREPKLIQIGIKNAHFGQTACKIHYNNLCIRFGSWKVRRLNQSRSKVAPKSKFPAGLGGKNSWAAQNEIRVPNRFRRPTFQVLDLLWSLRFGSWNVRSLNRTLYKRIYSTQYTRWILNKADRQRLQLLLRISLTEWGTLSAKTKTTTSNTQFTGFNLN